MLDALAHQLHGLRRDCKRTAFSDLGIHLDARRGYQVANKTARLTNRPVTAWKLGGTTSATRSLFQVNGIFFGPLLEGEVFFGAEESARPDLPLLAAEAEIALRISHRDWTSTPGQADTFDPAQTFDAWAPAIEFPYSCFRDLPEVGLGALLADRCAAGGLALGAARTGLPPAVCSLGILLGNGREVTGNSTVLLMNPVAAALEFCRRAREEHFTLQPGQWVTTGGITPCVPLTGEPLVTLKFEGEPAFTLRTGTEPRS